MNVKAGREVTCISEAYIQPQITENLASSGCRDSGLIFSRNKMFRGRRWLTVGSADPVLSGPGSFSLSAPPDSAFWCSSSALSQRHTADPGRKKWGRSAARSLHRVTLSRLSCRAHGSPLCPMPAPGYQGGGKRRVLLSRLCGRGERGRMGFRTPAGRLFQQARCADDKTAPGA